MQNLMISFLFSWPNANEVWVEQVLNNNKSLEGKRKRSQKNIRGLEMLGDAAIIDVYQKVAIFASEIMG